MFPTQDHNQGLGNVIALPLQGKALKNGNSAFVDENWNLYDCGKTAAACKWQSYRGLILFRAGIRDRKESQQSAVIDRKTLQLCFGKSINSMECL